MVRIFNIHIPYLALALALVDLVLLYLLLELSMELSLMPWPPGAPLALRLSDLTVQKLLFVLGTVTCLFMMGNYRQDDCYHFKSVAPRICTGLALAFLFLTVVFYLFPTTRIWMSALIPAFIASSIALLLSRRALRRIAGFRALRPRVLVLGAGRLAQKIEAIERLRWPPRFLCVGFLPMGRSDSLVSPERLIVSNDLRRTCAETHANEIVVALEEQRNMLPIDALLECRMRGTHISTLPSFVERELGQVEIDNLYPSWLVFSNGSSKGALSRFAKRTFDTTGGAALLTLALPLMCLVALAVWIEDGFPVFYRQERIGLNGQVFKIVKFRSMRRDAEKDGVARWATRHDPRVTFVGSVIRRIRLDELPQIWNVLTGDMSFVGPRPERPSLIAKIVQEVPFYECRHLVRPGITGWAQINFGYGDSVESSKEKLKFDLFYVKNCGLILDIAILLQTARVILWPQGAR